MTGRIVVPFPQKISGVNEDILQANMFTELDKAGLLKVKQFGAQLTIIRDNKPVARVIYLAQDDAVIVANKMLEYFGNHKMTNWTAQVLTCELF